MWSIAKASSTSSRSESENISFCACTENAVIHRIISKIIILDDALNAIAELSC
jgi:hypothetical protein